jgi:hypothetical protein
LPPLWVLRLGGSGDLGTLELSAREVLAVSVNRPLLAAKRQALEQAASKAKALLDVSEAGSPVARREELGTRLGALQARLDGPAKQHEEYLTALGAWEAERGTILGDAETPGSAAYLEVVLEALDQVPAQLQDLAERRRAKAREIYAEIARLADTYRVIYRPVQDFSSSHPLISERFGLNFSVTILPSGDLADRFFGIVHRGVSGSFCGMEEGEAVFKSLIDRHDFSQEAGALAFAEDVLEHLTQDKREVREVAVNVARQLRKGQAIEDLYDFIYSFENLEPRYNLNLGQKELSQLSPGERGMLLLMFYLLIDKEDIPLIVDQPEGNLDNQTAYKLLGECIRESKKRRQIIIVTHNPNLAVACDAEQVISAVKDQKDGERITYTAGAIEDPKINSLLINVLEGTRPAFDNRDAKYFAETDGH